MSGCCQGAKWGGWTAIILAMVVAAFGIGRSQSQRGKEANEPKWYSTLFTNFTTSPQEREEAGLEELRERQAKVRQTLDKVSDAVVSIADGMGAGSGVIISEDGYILTAGHVLMTDQPELQVTLSDGRTVKAKALGRNLNIDAGLAKLEGDGPYPYVERGSTKDLELGMWCVALGHPGGYQLGRTPPVRLGRLTEIADWMLVTDCTLIGGDSGGPLFDLDGKLIGIHSSIGPSVAENRHARIDGFFDSWDRLADGEAWGRLGGMGPPERDSAYLGVNLDLETNEAVVLEVFKGSAAEDAGLKVGDVITELDNQPIHNSRHFITEIAEKRAGADFSVRVQRNGRRIELDGKLGRYGDSQTRR